MADFDPALKRRTMIMREVGKDPKTGKPLYQEAGYSFVSYDEGVDRYIEPLSNYRFISEQVANPDLRNVDNTGKVDSIEFYGPQPLECQQFDQ